MGQAFLIERTAAEKKSGKTSVEYAFGVTSYSPDAADPQRLLELDRSHWKVEFRAQHLDNAFDEDRLRIRTEAPLRRHAPPRPQPRRVFDYLRMTENSCRPGKHAPRGVRTN